MTLAQPSNSLDSREAEGSRVLKSVTWAVGPLRAHVRSLIHMSMSPCHVLGPKVQVRTECLSLGILRVC